MPEQTKKEIEMLKQGYTEEIESMIDAFWKVE